MITITLFASLFIASSYAKECLKFDKAGFDKFTSGFDLRKVVAGDLDQICCGDDGGAIQLGPIDLAKILGGDGDSVEVAAQYRKGSQAVTLKCKTSKEGLKSLAQISLNEPEKADVSKVDVKCHDGDHEVFSVNGATLQPVCKPSDTTPGDPPVDPKPDPDPKPPVKPSDEPCDDIQGLIKSPLKFLLGANICVSNVGRFILNKVDLRQLGLVRTGQPLTVSGAYDPKGEGETIRLVCKLGAEMTTMLLPLAKDLDVSKLDTDALQKVVDLECHDDRNRHLVTIDGSNVKGLSFDTLVQKLVVAGINVKTFNQVYEELKDKQVKLGDFELIDGKLKYPGGELSVKDAVDFLGPHVAVSKDGDKVVAIATRYGKVEIKDGVVTYTNAEGKTFTIESKCTDIEVRGGGIVAKCGDKRVSFGPGFAVDRDGKVSNTDGEPKVVLRTFVVPKFCVADPPCLTNIQDSLRAAAKKKGCEISISVSADGKGRYKLACSNAEKSEADNIVNDVLLQVNDGKTEDEHVKVDDSLVDATPKPTSSASVIALSSALVAVVAAVVV